MCLGVRLRSGEGIGWLAAGTVPNSLYRVPFSYLFLACALCYCSFLFVVSVLFLIKRFLSFVFIFSLNLCRCSSDLFLSSRPRTGLTTTYTTGMVEARSVNNVMNTTTPIAVWCGDTIIVCYYYKVLSNYVLPKYIVLVGFGCGMYYNVFVGFLVSLYGD